MIETSFGNIGQLLLAKLQQLKGTRKKAHKIIDYVTQIQH
jgi:hypothetical protein